MAVWGIPEGIRQLLTIGDCDQKENCIFPLIDYPTGGFQYLFKVSS